ncbi:myosin-10 isoform X1 [Penaeus vannamei]|uniref:myosin-10 isoform X1 n=1 Tax=Penaeus vannamei TaxID=6689 RepID=UPI00387F59CC
MAVAAALCLTAILLGLCPGGLAGVIPVEEPLDAALTSDVSVPGQRLSREYFDGNARGSNEIEEDEAVPGREPEKDGRSLPDRNSLREGPGGANPEEESREERRIPLDSGLSASEISALNGEIKKQVNGELNKAEALLHLAEELGEPRTVAEGEESLNDLIDSAKEPSHAMRKRMACDAEEEVVEDDMDSFTLPLKEKLSKAQEELEDLFAKVKVSKRSDEKGILEELKDKPARIEEREAFEERLSEDELKVINDIEDFLEDLPPNAEMRKRDVVKKVLDKTAKINVADKLVKDELALINEVEEVAEELLPRDVKGRNGAQGVLEELLVNNKIVNKADEREGNEVLRELFPIDKLTKISEAEELLEELIPKSKPVKRSLNKGEDSLSEEEAVGALEDALLSEPSEGEGLFKRSSSNDEGLEVEDQENSAADELAEVLGLSTKDRHKRKAEEQMPTDLDLLKVKRMSRATDRASSGKSMIKDLIDDIHRQTDNAADLPDVKIIETVLALSDLTKPEEGRQKRVLGTIPKPRAISLDSEERDALEEEEPEGRRRTRSSAEKQSAREPGSRALEDDSSPPEQGSEAGTRRRRSVSKTDRLSRFSKYERGATKEPEDEVPRNQRAHKFDPYLLENNLDLDPADTGMLLSDGNLQEQTKDINGERLKSAKMLGDVDLQEGEEMPFPKPAKSGEVSKLRRARQLMEGEYESEPPVPQYVQDYNVAPTYQPGPESGQAAPESGQIAPESGQAAPESDQAAPESVQAAPESGQVAPESGQVAPESGQSASESGQAAPESGQAADSFWYGVPPDDELKEVAGANARENHTTQAESKQNEKKKEQNSPKAAKPDKDEKKKDGDRTSKAVKKSKASDKKREARRAENEQ